MDTLLEFRNVSRSFGANPVLAGASFRLPRGSVTALLGPNGAWKSTALRIAVNLLTPAAGEVEVLGTSSRRLGPEQFRRIVYVADGMELPLWMRGSMSCLNSAAMVFIWVAMLRRSAVAAASN